ncbi:zinc ribbon domain-containing protein [Methylogaea oryzae]|uniref:zinc ribbon domain-containing protein n=1 Tax=Methylogaea oryzae TaxID=1295382 RepID=UPI0020D0024B
MHYAIPDGDNRERHICTACDTIHYLNPKIVAGCIPVWEDKLLLCRRAIEPRHGLWTLPAGSWSREKP